MKCKLPAYWELPFTARYYTAEGEVVVEMPYEVMGRGRVKIACEVATLHGDIRDRRGRFVGTFPVEISSERMKPGDTVTLTKAWLTPTDDPFLILNANDKEELWAASD
jgi:hypothetical protein